MQPTATTHAQKVRQAVAYIRAHYMDALDVHALARHVGASPYHFNRLFAAGVGESIGTYLRRVRLEWAAQQLLLSEQPIADIALQAGYPNPESFSRAFRKHFATTPTAYRAQGGSPLAELQPPTALPTQTVQLPPRHVLYLAHHGAYAEVGPTWQQLLKHGYRKGYIAFWKKPAMLGLCYDNPDITAPERQLYEACVEVRPKAKPEGPFGVKEVPGGAYLHHRHIGPYEQLSATYRGLFAHILQQNIPLRALPYGSVEHYLNNPRRTPAHKLKTDVYIPIA